MTKPEFAEWLAHHSATFASLNRWLDALPAPGTTKAAWFHVLQECELEDCKVATNRIFSDPDRKLYGFDDHPAAVARIAREVCWERRLAPAQDEYHSSERYRCLDCRDTGFRTVWHPKTMQQVLQELENPQRYICSVACQCDLGADRKRNNDQLVGGLKRKPVPQFDPDIMVACSGRSDHESFDYLNRSIRQIQANTVRQMPNFDPVLSEF